MVKKFLFHRTDVVSVQVFRYILSGGAAYLVDYASLILLTELFRVYYLTSAAAAFLIGMAVSYILNVMWVFNKRSFSKKHLELFIFAVIGILSLVLNQYCIWFFTEKAGLHYLYSKIIATVFVFLTNFYARKYILFN